MRPGCVRSHILNLCSGCSCQYINFKKNNSEGEGLERKKNEIIAWYDISVDMTIYMENSKNIQTLRNSRLSQGNSIED